jgi:hypothetical protein|tara:strand:- start:471 stop:629 length:159 start_codon:yes stop_codon:yes gene_type:complete
MKKFKFYGRDDDQKEAIGIINATNLNEAYIKASNVKQLPPIVFDHLFIVEAL